MPMPDKGQHINHQLKSNPQPVQKTVLKRQKELLAAIDSQNEELIKALVKEGVNPLYTPKGDLSALSYIIMSDNVVALKALLEVGINPQKNTLFEAIYAYAAKSLKVLLEADNSLINMQNEEGKTLLMEAILQEHEGIERLLLEQGARADIADFNGETALTLSAFADNPAFMKNLLDFYPQLDVNVLARGNQTALMRSVAYNDVAQVKMLLKAGAHVDIANNEGKTALDMIPSWGNKELVILLKQAALSQRQQAVLHEKALSLGNEAYIKNLLTDKAFQAVSNRSPQALKALLDKGLSPDSVDENGFNLLSKAVYRNDADSVALLINSGADVNKKNAHGQTPLIIAAQWGFEKVLKQLLLCKDINPDCVDALGRTALVWASKNDNIAIVEALIQARADLNIKDNDGDTAVIMATRHGLARNVRLLVRAGGMIGVANKKGETALSLASQLKKHDIVSFFAECTKNPNIPGLCGNKIAHQNPKTSNTYLGHERD